MDKKIKNFVTRTIETLSISVIATIIANTLWPESLDVFSLLPSKLKYIPTPYYLLVIFTILFWAILPKRKTWESLNEQEVYSEYRRPTRIRCHYNVTSFGVKWKVLVGSDSITCVPGEGDYLYAEEPLCPKCGYELDTKQVPTYLGFFSKPCWYCHDCNESYDRPKKQLYREKEVVVKQVEKQIRNEN